MKQRLRGLKLGSTIYFEGLNKQELAVRIPFTVVFKTEDNVTLQPMNNDSGSLLANRIFMSPNHPIERIPIGWMLQTFWNEGDTF